MRCTGPIIAVLFFILHLGVAQVVIPELPKTELPDPYSDFWTDTENWPASLTNHGGSYGLAIRVGELGEDQIVWSFDKAKGRDIKFSASYVIKGSDFKKVPNPNSGHTFYGPMFTWGRDQSIRLKGFCYGSGLWDNTYYDAQGRVWHRIITDPVSNQAVLVLYDKEGQVVGYLRGADDPDKPYTGKAYCEIDGKKATEDDYFDFWCGFRESRLLPDGDESESRHNLHPNRRPAAAVVVSNETTNTEPESEAPADGGAR